MNIKIFDFDGVICNSNNVKTHCLKKAVEVNINKTAAEDFEKHHKLNGGISRYVKYKRIVEKYKCRQDVYDKMITDTSKLLKKEFIKLKLVDKAELIFKYFFNSGDKIFIASGGNEDEIKVLCERWGITKYFEGIYGSPKEKMSICKKIREKYKQSKIKMYGDSKYDYECAEKINAEFIFVSQYADSKEWFKENMGQKVLFFREILNQI